MEPDQKKHKKPMNTLEHLKQTEVINVEVAGIDASLTNGTLILFLAVALVVSFYFIVGRKAKLVPSLTQSAAELILDFIRSEMLSPLGREGEKWLPFLVSLFSLILVSNLLGLIPGFVPPTSNINVTATLAVIVFFTTHITGLRKHGPWSYLKSIVPEGLPFFIAAFLFPLELIGQLARPFSLTVRLFANLFAGHAIIITLVSLIIIFKSFLIAPFPVIGNTAIMAFEIFVAFIQAFVFTYLSASYIVGALQTEH